MSQSKEIVRNTTQLAHKIAKLHGLRNKQAEDIVHDVFATMASSLSDETLDRFTIAGFGNFTRKSYSARTGRNPKTNEAVQIAAHSRVLFREARQLKDVVNGRAEAEAPRSQSKPASDNPPAPKA